MWRTPNPFGGRKPNITPFRSRNGLICATLRFYESKHFWRWKIAKIHIFHASKAEFHAKMAYFTWKMSWKSMVQNCSTNHPIWSKMTFYGFWGVKNTFFCNFKPFPDDLFQVLKMDWKFSGRYNSRAHALPQNWPVQVWIPSGFSIGSGFLP